MYVHCTCLCLFPISRNTYTCHIATFWDLKCKITWNKQICLNGQGWLYPPSPWSVYNYILKFCFPIFLTNEVEFFVDLKLKVTWNNQIGFTSPRSTSSSKSQVKNHQHPLHINQIKSNLKVKGHKFIGFTSQVLDNIV